MTDRDDRAELRRLFQIAWPIILAQGGLVSMGMVDTWMIGRVSKVEMGAVSVGHNVILMVVLVGAGAVMGIEPLASQAYGAGERRKADRWLWQALWTGLFFWPPTALLVLAVTSQLERFGVRAEIAAPTLGYVLARLPELLFTLPQVAFRSYLSSLGRTRPIFVAVAAANLANIALNATLLFIFELGAVGVGLATSGSCGPKKSARSCPARPAPRPGSPAAA